MVWRLRRIIFRLAEKSLRAPLGRLRRKKTDRTRDCAGYLFLRRLSMEWRRIQKLAAKRPEAMTEFTETVIQ